MHLRMIETFSGIGAQAKALSNITRRLNNQGKTFSYEVVSTVEWEISAICAYDMIHHSQEDYTNYNHYSKADLLKILSKYNLSGDGKQPLSKESLSRYPQKKLQYILSSIERNHNLVDITQIHANDLPEADILTYSFPCQDLSISAYWHNNFSGISREANNRSGLLWEIERILYEYDSEKLPRYLLMENVTAIHSPKHEKDFISWQESLKNLGYINFCYDLDATDFGIPQKRVRTFMLSVYIKDLPEDVISNIEQLDYQFLTQSYDKPLLPLKQFLKLDYSNEIYRQEARESVPNFTPSRQNIYEVSAHLVDKEQNVVEKYVKTITTKQDRKPNPGIININRKELSLSEQKAPYRNLTPRETFLLMGFDERDFDSIMEKNIFISPKNQLLSQSKLLKLTGNSIVVQVLESLFNLVINIEEEIKKH